MKRILVSLAAATALVGALPVVADAAPWQTINQRKAEIDRRIDQGVRQGDLTRVEATRLRSDFQGLVRLEAQYRRSGRVFTAAERRDLDRRYDALSRQVFAQRHDRQDRPDRRG